MPCLVLSVFADAGHGSDRSHHQERKAGHLEPQLTRYFAVGSRGRQHAGQHRFARPAALHCLDGGAKI